MAGERPSRSIQYEIPWCARRTLGADAHLVHSIRLRRGGRGTGRGRGRAEHRRRQDGLRGAGDEARLEAPRHDVFASANRLTRFLRLRHAAAETPRNVCPRCGWSPAGRHYRGHDGGRLCDLPRRTWRAQA
eukprot:8505176-Pyramimonas_sp.AAC.4